ncbi:MAG: hypothetical protein QXP94_04645 [Thermofilaceae archaeon]
MSEREGPSAILVVITVVAFAFLAIVWVLTSGFSENPPYPPLISRILPLTLTAAAVLASIFAYNLAKDEEPEWSVKLGQRLQYKVIEGAAIACIILSLVFTVLIVTTYFL